MLCLVMQLYTTLLLWWVQYGIHWFYVPTCVFNHYIFFISMDNWRFLKGFGEDIWARYFLGCRCWGLTPCLSESDLCGVYFPGGSGGKASAYSAGDLGSVPGLARSPGEGNGSPLQYSYLENPIDGGAWWATVHGVTKSRIQLSDFTFTLCLGFCQWEQVWFFFPSPFSILGKWNK